MVEFVTSLTATASSSLSNPYEEHVHCLDNTMEDLIIELVYLCILLQDLTRYEDHHETIDRERQADLSRPRTLK